MAVVPVGLHVLRCLVGWTNAFDNFLSPLSPSLLALVQMKASMRDVEAIKSDIVGQAHVENFALKLFQFADIKDRSGIFNK